MALDDIFTMTQQNWVSLAQDAVKKIVFGNLVVGRVIACILRDIHVACRIVSSE